MKQTYILRENKKVIQVLNKTDDDFLAAVKNGNPDIANLIEDEGLSQLQDILVLLRVGYLKAYTAKSHDGGIFKIFELKK